MNAQAQRLANLCGPRLESPDTIAAESLGSEAFRNEYGLRYAYLTGAMYKGIASKELVVALGRAGLMGYLGTGGRELEEIAADIRHIQSSLASGGSWGVNFLCNLERPDLEDRAIDLFDELGVTRIEAAAFLQLTPSVVRYRLQGLKRLPSGAIEMRTHVLAKVSRPEVAAQFMQPPPESMLRRLVESGGVSEAQALLGQQVPVANEICVESDSGGHTDQGVALALFPAMLTLRDRMMAKHGFASPIRIGAAGGIGTPQAAAAAFIMGADFIMTGSINQCTVEAGISEAVKDLLQEIGVQDTTYAPAGDMFELGAKVQVVRKGLFFPARANKLYELYQRYGALEEIDEKTRQQIQEKFFRRSFAAVWEETRAYYLRADPKRLQEIEANPRQKMALIFKWYFVHSTRLAMQGSAEQKIDYQIHCGPALGAFNEWVRETELRNWRHRRVADIAELMMRGAAQVLNERYAAVLGRAARTPGNAVRSADSVAVG